MGHLVAVAQDVHRRRGIAAADDGDGVGLSQRLCNCLCAMRKVGHLKAAHGSIPYNGLRVLHRCREQLFGLRSDIQSLPAVRDLASAYHLLIAVVGESVTNAVVHRKKKLHALFLRLFHHAKRVLHVVVLAQGGSDMAAHGLAERIRHAAADDQNVYLVKQILNNGNLAGNLGAAQDRYKGSLGIVYCVSKEVNLLLHQVAYNRGVHILRHTYVGAVRSMSRSESVVYENIAERSQLFAELIAVLGLFRAVTGILKENHVAVLHRLNRGLRVRANHFRISGKLYFLAKELGQALRNRCQGQLRLGLSLGFSKVGAKDHLSSVRDQFLNSRKSGHQTVFIRNMKIRVQGHVKITAHKNSLAFYIDIINGFFVKHGKCLLFLVLRHMRALRPMGLSA